MSRDGWTGEPTAEVQGLEERADRLAVALLAPPGTVLRAARPFASDFPGRLQNVINVLNLRFGLPREAARRYAWSLLVTCGRDPSLAESLRL